MEISCNHPIMGPPRQCLSCESHDGIDSLMGVATKSGYNSPFVVTDTEGRCVTIEKANLSNEIVVSQESQSQISPVFIFKIDRSNLHQLQARWEETVSVAQSVC